VKKVRKKGKEWLTSGPPTSVREGKNKGGGESWATQLDGLMGLFGWAGSG
jgi:hypothetical protein